MSVAATPTPPSRVGWTFAFAILAWFIAFALAPFAFFALGVNHFGPWFLDTYAILASNDAVTAGLNPYTPNPLDPFGRPHVYARAWLHLRDLGLTRQHTLPVGFGLVLTFIFSVLATVQPRTWREAIGYFFVLGSPPVLLALDRANNDLVVFLLLVPVVPCLLHASRVVRLVPVFLIAAATLLKFYPAVAALVLLLVGDRREVRERALVAGLGLGIAGVSVVRDLALLKHLLPRADGLTTFGAVNLLEAMGLRGGLGWLVVGVFVGVVAIFALRSRMFDPASTRAVDRGEWLSFALGAGLLTGCFFAGTNYAYRWIFALWMAPLLWSLPLDATVSAGLRRLARLTRALLLFALWADPLASAFLTRIGRRLDAATIDHLAERFFLLEQPVTWALFACLLFFCIQFVRAAVQPLFSPPATEPS